MAIESVKVLEEENMVQNSLKMGEILLNGLKNVKKEYI